MIACPTPTQAGPSDPACDDAGCTTNPMLEPETFEFGAEEPDLEAQAYYNGLLAVTDVRCKRQTFTATFKQLGWVTVIKYEGQFRVCYRPGQSIISWRDLHGDATETVVPWEWRGNDPGYPYGVQIDAKTLQLNYRGSAAVCIFWKGCGPTKHPWVRIVFYADNTLSKEWGVA